jgi:hypothetical protein
MLRLHDTVGPSSSQPPRHDTVDSSTSEPPTQAEHTQQFLSSGVMDLFCGHDISGPSSSQPFISGADLTLYTSSFAEIFGQDNISSDPHVVPEQSAFDIDGDDAAFDTPPLAVRRDRRDPQPPNRYTPS